MKRLEEYKIYYDRDCPLCQVYTAAFVRTGMLEPAGRGTYQEMDPEACRLVNRERAVNEIPLLDRKTGTVYYGVDSLVRVIGNSFPFIQQLYRLSPVKWLSWKAYRFISFNRKVIVPGQDQQSSHQPAFHPGYRAAYLLFAWMVTALILHHFSPLLASFIPAGSFYREALFCGGQLLWQAFWMGNAWQELRWNYLGQVMTVSLIGGLLLLPALVIGNWLPAMPSIFYIFYFGAVVLFMVREHHRRVGLLGLSHWLTVTWLLYRLLLLFILL